MKGVGVDEIADELYGLPPDDFTRARDAAARAATDSATGKAIKALRKPTASAYAVNQLVRERTGDIDELLALADELRTAMAGRGGDVRQLTEQRRALVGGLVGADVPAAVRADVTATLEAATADPEVGAAVRSGRLVRPLRYAGFGALPDLSDAVATPVKAAKPVRTKPSPAKTAASTADLDAARRHVLQLAGAADDAQRRYDAAVRAAVEAREKLDAAEAERAEAHRAARAAHAEAEKARRELGRLERS
jgi:hypothetical protein